jgi:hypothetical protein
MRTATKAETIAIVSATAHKLAKSMTAPSTEDGNVLPTVFDIGGRIVDFLRLAEIAPARAIGDRR